VYVLSDRPATIRMVLEQDAPRPRTLDYLETSEFKHNERVLLSELTESTRLGEGV
jgi:ABC-type nitrate/sulfonate/bicarbonate transport system ATPase subunit